MKKEIVPYSGKSALKCEWPSFNALEVKEFTVYANAKITDIERTLDHLHVYRWSSYLDYCGSRNFPSVVSKELFLDVFGDYNMEVREYLNDLKFETIRPYFLE